MTRFCGGVTAWVQNMWASGVQAAGADDDVSMPMGDISMTAKVAAGLFVGGTVAVAIVGSGGVALGVGAAFMACAFISLEIANVADGCDAQSSLNTWNKVNKLFEQENWNAGDKKRVNKALKHTIVIRHLYQA